MKLYPRFQVKRDSESSVGRGCVLLGAHFRPEIAAIPWACSRAIHELGLEIAEVILTEGFRTIRDSRDLHEEVRALDLVLMLSHGVRASDATHRHVAEKMGELLGADYDLLAHEPMHIHAELDPL